MQENPRLSVHFSLGYSVVAYLLALLGSDHSLRDLLRGVV